VSFLFSSSYLNMRDGYRDVDYSDPLSKDVDSSARWPNFGQRPTGFTVASWHRYDSTIANYPMLWRCTNSSNWPSNYDELRVQLDPTAPGQMLAAYSYGAGAMKYRATTQQPVVKGQWWHFALVLQPCDTNPNAFMYWNGQMAGSFYVTGPLPLQQRKCQTKYWSA
jgi:hypothetical protein